MIAAQGIALVLAGAVLEGVAQVCLKHAAVPRIRRAHWLAAGVLLFLLEILLYTRALQILPVSVAYPLSAFSYAAVVLAARMMLGERPDRRRWFGVLLVALGAACAIPT